MNRAPTGRCASRHRPCSAGLAPCVRLQKWQRLIAPSTGLIRCSALEDNVNNAKSTTSSSKDSPSSPALRAQRRWLRRKKVLRNEPDPADNDILELNVDGRQIITHRSTLTLMKGSRLAEMFSKGNESQLLRDRDGKVFLDFNASAFQIILKYLRELKISNGAFVPLPDIKPEDRSSFRALVSYLQLDMPCWQPDLSADEQMLAQLQELSQHITDPAAGQKLAAVQAALLARLSTADATAAAKHQEQEAVQDAEAGADDPAQQRRSAAAGAAAAAKALAAASSGAAASSTATGTTQKADSSSGAGGSSSSSSRDLVLKRPQSTSQGSGLPLILDRNVQSSQLYYITTRRDRVNGLSLSICTEEEYKAAQVASNAAGAAAASSAAGSPSKLDIMCDVTWSDARLTYTIMLKKQFKSMHLGATSRNQLRRRGMHIPHYGWKQQGHTYNLPPPLPPSKGRGRPRAGTAPALDLTSELPALWRKGDCIELIIDLKQKNRLMLKVNGKETDFYKELPSHRNWCWYMALSACEGDKNMSCVVFDRDCYDVYWSDFRVSRFRD